MWDREAGYCRLDTKNRESLWQPKDKVSRCIRDVLEAEESNDRDDKVPECGHYLRSVTRTHSRTILIKAHISYVVHSVFNFPMSPIQLQYPLSRCLFGGETGNAVHCLIPYLTVRTLSMTLKGKKLLGVREIHISLQLITDPDRSPLKPSVFFVDLLVIGLFFCDQDHECHPATFADCPSP